MGMNCHSGHGRAGAVGLAVTAVLLLFPAWACGGDGMEGGERPNLVVFLVDDLGWQDTAVAFTDEPTPANRHFRTPNLERLAAQGCRFTCAYACAVCTPSRISLMTGLNAARHQTTNWTLFPDRETSGVTPRLKAPGHWRRGGLQPDASLPTLAEILRDAFGYRTIHAGKAHWGAWDTAGADPTNLGFDINIAGHAAGGPGHYHGQAQFGNANGRNRLRPWGVPGLHKYHGTETHLTEATTIEAIAAVREAVADGLPFFLHLAHYAVHAPIQPHRRHMGHYSGKAYGETGIPIPPAEQAYASMVEGMDASLGELLAALETLGVADNTLVLFGSDNGGLSYHSRGTTPRNTGRNTHCWPLREGKGSAYEGGIRIPVVVSWARRNAAHPAQQRIPITANSRSGRRIIIEDFFPSLVRWAGGGTTGTRAQRQALRDGIDFTGALSADSGAREDDASARERNLYFHYPHQWTGKPEGGYQPHSSIISGDWKAIYFYEPRRWELYNLAEDIGEERNLSGEAPGQLQALAALLRAYLVRVGAQWPEDRKTGKAEPLLLPDETAL